MILITVAHENKKNRDAYDSLRCAESIRKELLNKKVFAEIFHIKKNYFYYPGEIAQRIKSVKPDCIFNLFEGFSNDTAKEIEFAKILENIGVPFTGNTSGTLEKCLNKRYKKQILSKNNIPVPKGIFIRDVCELEKINFSGPFFIKPCFEDGSVGIEEDSLIEKKEQLRKITVRKLKKFPQGLILEEFIFGKEYALGFLGNHPYETIGVSMLSYDKYQSVKPFLSYMSKWNEGSCAHKLLNFSFELNIGAEVINEITNMCARVGELLGCQGYFRVDLREKNGSFFVLDVNPNPDINVDSGFIKQAYNKGYSYGAVLDKILSFVN